MNDQATRMRVTLARPTEDFTGAIAKETERRFLWRGADFPRPLESRDEDVMLLRIARSPEKRCLHASAPSRGSYAVGRAWARAWMLPDNAPCFGQVALHEKRTPKIDMSIDETRI